MTCTLSLRRRMGVLLAAGAIGASTALIALTPSATALAPCGVSMKRIHLESQRSFAGGGVLKRYTASVNYPGGKSKDQTGKVMLSVYPKNAVPRLINAKLGARTTIGDMVKAQQSQALAAINGFWWQTPTIRGQEVALPRSVMVKNGQVIRGIRQKQRVVGVDTKGNPVAGRLGVRGFVKVGSTAAVDLRGVNWQYVKPGGVTVYTDEWRASTATPRPAGKVELVINGNDRVQQVRSSTKNAGQRGAPVANGTRVLAYSGNLGNAAARADVGTPVDVKVRQATSTGVRVRHGIGRGTRLVENGVAAPLGCAAYDHSWTARPRTLVGWTAGGAWRSITVPGNRFVGGLRLGGFGLANEAAIAKRLGLEFAYELDGGGSTTLYTRSKAGQWTRRDLWSFDTTTGKYERPVMNGLAFVAP